jgi:hypothetical protein
MTTAKRRHGRSAGKPGQYQHECDICRSTFARAEHLSRHKRTVHSQEKKFRCDICGKSCSRSDNLRQHRKTHRSASKGDIDTEGGDDSEEENYARDDESIESNWEADQPELAVVPPISTGVRKDGPITTRSVEGYGRNAVAEQDPEANTTKGARANEGTSTSNSAHKHSGQREAKLAAAGERVANMGLCYL